ncbi:MAG: S8 family serine peptidase [Dehalococcoidia bacterium]
MTRPYLWLAVAVVALIAGGLAGRASLSVGPPAPEITTAPLLPPGAGTTGLPYMPGEVLVKLRPGHSLQRLRDEAEAALGVVETTASALLPRLHRLRLPPGADVEEAAAALGGLPQVEYAEPNYVLHLAAVPNDRFYPRQSWYYDLLGAPTGWDVETGDPSVVVAVLDSGIDLDHPDLENKVWRNPGEVPDGVDNDGNGFVDDVVGWNFVDNDNNPDDDSPIGHGTFVAGLIGAETNNGEGVAGVAWGVTLMSVKVVDSEGIVSIFDTINALFYAARNGARIINLSLAGPCITVPPVSGAFKDLGDAINQVRQQHGAIIVSAAGNRGEPCVSYPASDPGVVGVGASSGPVVEDPDEPSGLACSIDGPFDPDQRAVFSLGPNPSSSNWGPEIDVVAPGQCLASTSNGQDLGLYSSSPEGTSFSTALVSGLAALLLSQDTSRTEGQVRLILCASAVDLPDDDTPGWDGCGRIDISRALTQELHRSILPTVTKE